MWGGGRRRGWEGGRAGTGGRGEEGATATLVKARRRGRLCGEAAGRRVPEGRDACAFMRCVLPLLLASCSEDLRISVIACGRGIWCSGELEGAGCDLPDPGNQRA